MRRSLVLALVMYTVALVLFFLPTISEISPHVGSTNVTFTSSNPSIVVVCTNSSRIAASEFPARQTQTQDSAFAIRPSNQFDVVHSHSVSTFAHLLSAPLSLINVVGIINLGTFQKMARITARRIITSVSGLINWFSSELHAENESGSNHFRITKPKPAVTAFDFRTDPRPALVGFTDNNLGPKPSDQCVSDNHSSQFHQAMITTATCPAQYNRQPVDHCWNGHPENSGGFVMDNSVQQDDFHCIGTTRQQIACRIARRPQCRDWARAMSAQQAWDCWAAEINVYDWDRQPMMQALYCESKGEEYANNGTHEGLFQSDDMPGDAINSFEDAYYQKWVPAKGGSPWRGTYGRQC